MYLIYNLAVHSDLWLPGQDTDDRDSERDRLLTISHQPQAFKEFAKAHWISKRYAGFLRTYDTGNGVLICAGQNKQDAFNLWFSKAGREAYYDVRGDYTSVLMTNLGISVSTLLQGDLPLHGAAVKIDGHFIGVLGHSQVGKSTLLWRLLDTGAMFASDDVFTVKARKREIVAYPSTSLHAKLSRQELDARDEDHTLYQEMLPNSSQYWVPIASNKRITEASALTHLFILHPSSSCLDHLRVSVHRLTTGDAVSALMDNTHGLWAVSPLLNSKRMFHVYAMVSQIIPIYVLSYNRSFGILPDLVAAIRGTIISETQFSRSGASH